MLSTCLDIAILTDIAPAAAAAWDVSFSECTERVMMVIGPRFKMEPICLASFSWLSVSLHCPFKDTHTHALKCVKEYTSNCLLLFELQYRAVQTAVRTQRGSAK